MAGEGLYDRYKDALKRGHVAALKGHLDDALDAYADASRIAPERSTPHTAAGTALLRRKRPADALAYYDAAVRVGPRDEAALLGRAQALVALDRRADAADAYDALADLRARSGKIPDAVDAARRALELAEGRERRRQLERLIGKLRGSGPDTTAREALEKALRVLEGPKAAAPTRTLSPAEAAAMAASVEAMDAEAPAEPAGALDQSADAVHGQGVVGSGTEAGAVARSVPDVAAEHVPESAARSVPEAVAGLEPDAAGESHAAGEPDAADFAAVDPGLEAALAAVDEEPVEPDEAPAFDPFVAAIPAALERDLPPGIDLDGLAKLAEAAVDAGETALAVDRLLDLAAANRLYGTQDAAVDACYQGLSFAPDHVGLHLALVQLYDERGWSALATEKLALLDRLVGLDADTGAAARVEAAKATRA